MDECKDCKKPYDDFGLDTVLPLLQWNEIAVEGTEIMLCANCIVKRASKFDKVIVAHMILEIVL